MNELNLILLGPPGAGKGTQAARLREDFDLPYIATGDLLRAHRARGTDLGHRAARYMETGRLVPDELVTEMVDEEIAGTSDRGFLLDGFPRTLPQADALAATLQASGRSVSAVLLIEVPDDVLVERIGGRRVCPDGHVYHVRFNPSAREGICDQDGKPLIQRDDDMPDTVRNRLRVYHRDTEPLIEHYAGRGLVRRIDGTRPPDEVYEQLRETLASARLEQRA